MLATILTTRARTGFEFPPRLGLLYGVLLLCALAYWPGSLSFAEVWTSPEDNSYRHGPFIVVGCLWMLFHVRHQVAAAPGKPSWVAFSLLLIASFLWAVTWQAAIRDAYLLLVPAIAWLAVVAATGWAVGRTVGWAFAFLYMAAPAWGSAASTLQDVTAHVVDWLLPLVGIPSELSGSFIRVPAGVFEIAPGCSGLHYLTVGITIGLLAGELESAGWRRRLTLVAVVAMLSVVSNWLRVLLLVVIGQFTQMQHPLVSQDHYWFGWAVFALMLGLFVFWARRTEQPQASSADHPVPTLAREPVLPYARAAAAAAVIPLFAYGASAVADAQSASVGASLPAAPAGWSGPSRLAAAEWRPVFVGADSLEQGTYVDPSGRTVQALVVFYRAQRQGRELVNYANSLVGTGFAEVGTSVARDGSQRFIETMAADSAGRHWLVWSEYETAGRTFASALPFQLWYGLNAVTGAPGARLFGYRVACDQSCDAARTVLADFTRALRSKPPAGETSL
jgi:EpsI family protein